MWDDMLVVKGEPLKLVVGSGGHAPGSDVHVYKFNPARYPTILKRVEEDLKVQLRQWEKRTGFDARFGDIREGVFANAYQAVLKEFLKPLKVGFRQDSYWMPAVHIKTGSTLSSTTLYPYIQLKEEEGSRAGMARAVSMHCSFGVRPSVICPASELLSKTFQAGEHVLIAHLPKADSRRISDPATTATVLLTRNMVLDDVFVSLESDLTNIMLRSGDAVKDLHFHVRGVPGTWRIRHACFARES